MQDMVDAAVGRRKNAMPIAYEGRMYTYMPQAMRITLFFFANPEKNTYKTVIWNDGLEFIVHHVLTLFTAWGALVQGNAHFYVLIYFGVSEISTACVVFTCKFWWCAWSDGNGWSLSHDQIGARGPFRSPICHLQRFHVVNNKLLLLLGCLECTEWIIPTVVLKSDVVTIYIFISRISESVPNHLACWDWKNWEDGVKEGWSPLIGYVDA